MGGAYDPLGGGGVLFLGRTRWHGLEVLGTNYSGQRKGQASLGEGEVWRPEPRSGEGKSYRA